MTSIRRLLHSNSPLSKGCFGLESVCLSRIVRKPGEAEEQQKASPIAMRHRRAIGRLKEKETNASGRVQGGVWAGYWEMDRVIGRWTGLLGSIVVPQAPSTAIGKCRRSYSVQWETVKSCSSLLSTSWASHLSCSSPSKSKVNNAPVQSITHTHIVV